VPSQQRARKQRGKMFSCSVGGGAKLDVCFVPLGIVMVSQCHAPRVAAPPTRPMALTSCSLVVRCASIASTTSSLLFFLLLLAASFLCGLFTRDGETDDATAGCCRQRCEARDDVREGLRRWGKLHTPAPRCAVCVCGTGGQEEAYSFEISPPLAQVSPTSSRGPGCPGELARGR
jgi:hypothetical protein